jgi:hypothetical protein
MAFLHSISFPVSVRNVLPLLSQTNRRCTPAPLSTGKSPTVSLVRMPINCQCSSSFLCLFYGLSPALAHLLITASTTVAVTCQLQPTSVYEHFRILFPSLSLSRLSWETNTCSCTALHLLRSTRLQVSGHIYRRTFTFIQVSNGPSSSSFRPSNYETFGNIPALKAVNSLQCTHL